MFFVLVFLVVVVGLRARSSLWRYRHDTNRVWMTGAETHAVADFCPCGGALVPSRATAPGRSDLDRMPPRSCLRYA